MGGGGSMMDDIGEMTLDEYRDALASTNPTPGGGTAAAVALSQAAALTCMVAELTLSNDKWEGGWLGANEAGNIAVRLLARGHELAGEDADAFDAVMDAFRLPKSSDDELAIRRTVIHETTHRAAEVPLDTARNAYALLDSLPELARSGNANAVTDVGVAGLLATAACMGALLNVEINAKSLPGDLGEDLIRTVDELRVSANQISEAVVDAVARRLIE